MHERAIARFIRGGVDRDATVEWIVAMDRPRLTV